MGNAPLTIACILNLDEALALSADVYLFPEGCKRIELQTASRRRDQAVVVGAYEDGGSCRGAIYKAGVPVLSYLKVRSDGRTRGSSDADQHPVYHDGPRLSIGVIVCMDIDHPAFSTSVIKAVRMSGCSHRVICVPADMDSSWLSGTSLPWPNKYNGVNVALCNNIDTHGDFRCHSFISDTECTKIAIQEYREPVSLMFGNL